MAFPDRIAGIRGLAWRAWMVEAVHPAGVDLLRAGATAVGPDGISRYGPAMVEGVAAGQILREAMLPGRPGYDMMTVLCSAMLAATSADPRTTTPGSSRAEALAAGLDLLRNNLAATGLGLSLHPVSQALQEFPGMAGPYCEAQAMLGAGATVPMLGRLGFRARRAARAALADGGRDPPGMTDPPLFALLNEVSIIEHLARNRLERALPDGLRMSHSVVLNHLTRLGDGRSLARIARAVQVERPAMTNTIQKLEARGLVRLDPDPRDGRGKLVHLTEAGRAAREEAVAIAEATIAPVAADITADEISAAMPLLRHLRAALDRVRDDDMPPPAP